MSGAIELYGFEPDSMAENIARLYESWHTGREPWAKRVAELIQYVYATSTRETTNSQNGWSHSTHIPKLTQIHDNLGANYASALFSNRKFFSFDPANMEEATLKKRMSMENYLRTKHDYNGFSDTMLKLLNDWVQTGNCFAQVEYVREFGEDYQGNSFIKYEGPKVNRISPYDIVFDYAAKDFQCAAKVFRTLTTRGELLKMQQDMNKYDPEMVQKVMDFRGTVQGYTDSEINKLIQQRYDGFTDAADYLRSGQVELMEFVGDIYDMATDTLYRDRLITIADRRFILRNDALEDYQGYGRVYHCAWRDRPDNLWGQGPLDNLVGMQYLINHLENARADAFDQMLSPDRVHIGNVQIEQDGPVTNYYIDDGNGSVVNLAPDATALQADFQIQIKEAQMEAYAGAPREAMGIRTAGEKTAFEVQQLQNAAGRLFQHKIEQFEKNMLEPVLNGEIEVAVKNLSGSDVAKVLDEDEGVIEFTSITRDDLTARGKLKARGASHFAKRAQLVQELSQFGQVLASDPEMKVHFPAMARAKAWNQALGFDELELFQPFGAITEQQEMQVQAQAAQAVGDEQQAGLEGGLGF